MHATLGLKMTISVIAAHQQGRGLDCHFLADLEIDNLRSEIVALDPALIHAQQHIGPVTGFRATGARVNRDEGIRAIVFAR